ncbi:MAG: hypothetical protein HY047_15080 [Acidobacteria bacterium]|nr:hypothetical protein [Acidobacteriota bacterium]
MIFLLVVTVCAMLLAAIMSVVAWRLAGEERRRSEARVAVLAAEIHEMSALDLDLRPAQSVALSADLFSTAQPEPSAVRWATVVGLGLFGFSAMLALVVGFSGAQSVARPAHVSRAAAPAPLELIALDHARDGDRLVIRGVVRNPASGSAVARLTAVVFLFNRDGGFLTSERTAVNAAPLVPGAESPFAVTVTGADDVGRYRLSFRSDDRIVSHVDKRGKS